MSDVGGIVNIARCPEHGLHGQRDTCFECGGPVEQVAMVKADMSDDAVIRAHQTARIIAMLRQHAEAGCDGGHWYFMAADLIERRFGKPPVEPNPLCMWEVPYRVNDDPRWSFAYVAASDVADAAAQAQSMIVAAHGVPPTEMNEPKEQTDA